MAQPHTYLWVLQELNGGWNDDVDLFWYSWLQSTTAWTLSIFVPILCWNLLCSSPFMNMQIPLALNFPNLDVLGDTALGKIPQQVSSPYLLWIINPSFSPSLAWLCLGLMPTKRWTQFSGDSGKEPTCQSRRQRKRKFNPWVRKIPWRRKWQPTPIFLPEEFHGQRSLTVYCRWGHIEWDMTEQPTLTALYRKSI